MMRRMISKIVVIFAFLSAQIIRVTPPALAATHFWENAVQGRNVPSTKDRADGKHGADAEADYKNAKSERCGRRGERDAAGEQPEALPTLDLVRLWWIDRN